MSANTSCNNNSELTNEGDGGISSSSQEPFLGARTGHNESDDSRRMRQHLRRQLNGIGRVDLATGEYPG